MPRGVRNAVRSDQRSDVRRAQYIPKDRFDFDPSQKPPHMSYQWVAVSVMGDRERAKETLLSHKLAGWTPVPAGRHPEISGATDSGDTSEIERGGQLLMERPTQLTKAAQKADKVRAEEQVTEKLQSINAAARAQGGGSKTRLERGFQPIPED